MNSDVIFKLLGFTLAMVTAPIGMYFLTVKTIFSGELSVPLVIIHLWQLLMPEKTGNSTFAGATAAITANVVLIAYIVVAWREDQGEKAVETKEKEKKAQ